MEDADQGQGYLYHPWFSTSGIFTEEEEEDSPVFFHTHPTPIDPAKFPASVSRATAISSSQGLMVFHCSDSYYRVGNPFVRGPDAYRLLPRPPRHHQSSNTSVVIATALSPPTPPIFHPVFHLVCAIHMGQSYYTFDIYSSRSDRWFSDQKSWFLGGEILDNTGIGWGNKACWLIESTRGLVATYDAVEEILKILPLPRMIPKEAMLQLGRVGMSLGMVIVNPKPTDIWVELHLHDGHSWDRFSSLEMELCPDADYSDWVTCTEEGFFPKMSGPEVLCKEVPWPIRFESFKMEVLLWVRGWLLRWENSTVDPLNPRCERVMSFPFARGTPARIADAVPHVFNFLIPGNCILYPA